MRIRTRNFGEIDIKEEKIIKFQEGIPGFEEEKEFIIVLNEDEENPFHFLQSVKNLDLSFVILNPFEIFSDYDILLPEIATNKLMIEKQEEVAIYSMVVVPEDMTKMTTNLLGPIVINTRKRLGKQVILDDERYTTKHFIFNQDSKTGGE
ncbi:flagellar assembly protein FliW [Tissierella sp.]|uniref:flagellar assembly protein FliW n=1 Tax=Tissierella sp. TaxID=41274 RepID=UPI002860F3A9|nr:flagellar assembly protein FliW [Tissierella sp.]MDR7856920.1 flagellar assembly protein FliW [Tissierella sp.]